ncbi:hypothetical protein [Flavobacterium sp.]|uniref:hypothetical protein n=1 Tax=Flavobacterium sp. TaxID=239 RepID=UPI00260F867E|nr:hypothetical protein [Flavobacterium sp.]
MKNKLKWILLLVLVLSVGGYFFIEASNDHAECSTLRVYSKDKDGNQVVTERHACKEKYSF